MEQSIHERQEEELQVLQAIYMNEFEDERNPQQIKSGSPPVVRLKLTPLHSIMRQEVHAKVDLVIKYTTRYPTDPPLLRLENAKGLSKEQISGLKKDLDLQAKQLIGEVMVLQLAQSVQAFLHKHNFPTLSFHDQMLKNMQKEKEMRDKETERRLAKDKAQAKEIDDDVNKMVQVALQEREEAMKEERKRRQQTTDENRADLTDLGNDGVLMSSSPNNNTGRKSIDNGERLINGGLESKVRRRESLVCSRISQQVEMINFSGKLGETVVHCGKCVDHNFQGACTRSGLDLENGEIVSVCEWTLKSKKAKRKPTVIISGNLNIENVYQQVCGMEQELSYLTTKLQHPNLVHYRSICIEMKDDSVTVRILLDYLNGSSLAESIEAPGVPIETLKDYTKQLVCVLNYLHSKSIVHRDLQPLHVFVTKGNLLKVSGYAVLRRLSDLYNLLQDEGAEQDEFADYRKLVKPGKKGDIFNLGLVVLSLLQGKIATGYPVEIPAGLPDDLQDFLLRCLNIDEKERWSASQLLKHSFLIVQSSPYNFNSSNVGDATQDPGQGEGANDETNFLHSLNELNIPSRTRLVTDFEILESLGKGGFGDVIKARKKLDGLLYAIKRINLNPKSAQLKKRIIREVKLLSRLNHENVVRYYSSWIEAEEISSGDAKSSETGSETDSKQRRRTISNNQTKDEPKEDSLLKYNNFEAPSEVPDINDDDISWCDDDIKRESDTEDRDSDSDSSSSSGFSNDRRADTRVKHSSGFLKRSEQRDSSDGVMFKMDDSMFQFGDVSDTDDESEGEPLPSLATTETNTSEATFAQYLYIQMEYCEKSTLRNVIDEGLYKNHDRMWRLFREIVEGLSHVHSQGIIHRDLKPVNIFMDSRDQVKIGDFGLATSHTAGQLDQSMVSLSIASEAKASGDSSNRMTGKVGTYLYAAPEIDGQATKVKISEKVDMYSLGIIFFEMCYKPLLTGMERVKVIGMLRTEKIILPEAFEEKPRPKERKLLFWLLNHNSEERPTANELLESGLIPPKLEDRHFDELLALTLKQTSSTKYKRLTAALFSQNPDPVTEQIYDMYMDQYKEGSITMAHAYEYVESVLREVFTQHGAINQDIPLLLPKCRVFEEYDSIANVMDPEGIILSLPFDSRVGLARYIARNGIYNMKRYNIGKVYRDTKIHRAHPIEIKECSFDIISDSSNSMIPDAEVLYSVEEIVKYFPNLKHRNFYVRMNHTLLLKAILLQSNLDDNHTDKIYSILQCSKDTKDCISKIKAFLLDKEIAEHNVNKLIMFLEFEGPVNKAREVLQSLRKSRGQVGILAKQAFNDLLGVVRNSKLFGLEIPIFVQTSLAYNVNMFSGIVFQFVAENKRKRKHGGVDILAAGGRYDKLIEMFKRPNDQKHFPRAVGISIAVEKIVNSVLLDVEKNESIPSYLNECDVLVGSMGESSLLEQRLGVIKELWAAGIRAKLSSYDVHHDASLEALQEYCKEAGINNLLLLKEAEAHFVRVRTRDKEKFTESKVARHMMCEYLQQMLASDVKDVSLPGQKMQTVPQTPSSDSPLINTTFLLHDKLAKRRIESQILSKLSNVIQQSFLKTPVEVVVVDLPLNSLKTVFAYLCIDDEDDEFEASVSDIIDRQKQKKSAQYILRVCTTLREIKRERSVVVLYGYKDDFYRIFV